jgi:RNA polymerase sigma factor (sigma-70 family)
MCFPRKKELAVSPHVGHSTYLPLLNDTQAFLKSMVEDHAPDTMLVEAWDEFYRVYNNLIRRFVIARGLRNADADDCIQEVWFEVAARLGDFEHPISRPGLRAWLYTVVRSKATDVARRNRRKALSMEAMIQSGNEPESKQEGPNVALERQWDDAVVLTILGELRNRESTLNYRVLHMRLLEGRSVADVAAALEITSEQVWYRYHRMLKKLKAQVALYTGKTLGQS